MERRHASPRADSAASAEIDTGAPVTGRAQSAAALPSELRKAMRETSAEMRDSTRRVKALRVDIEAETKRLDGLIAKIPK